MGLIALKKAAVEVFGGGNISGWRRGGDQRVSSRGLGWNRGWL